MSFLESRSEIEHSSLAKIKDRWNLKLLALSRDQGMPAYIAMLRGVNITGNNSIKMEQLRGLCNSLGFQNVETYVQSGNIVFQTRSEDPLALSKSIGEAILESFGFDVPVIMRTSKEMRSVIANNPFLKEKKIDSSKLHVTFLSESPQKGSLKKLGAIAMSPDQYYSASHEIYLYCPAGYGRTKLSNNAIEKALSVSATTRNWRTTNTLFEMVSKI